MCLSDLKHFDRALNMLGMCLPLFPFSFGSPEVACTPVPSTELARQAFMLSRSNAGVALCLSCAGFIWGKEGTMFVDPAWPCLTSIWCMASALSFPSQCRATNINKPMIYLSTLFPHIRSLALPMPCVCYTAEWENCAGKSGCPSPPPPLYYVLSNVAATSFRSINALPKGILLRLGESRYAPLAGCSSDATDQVLACFRAN